MIEPQRETTSYLFLSPSSFLLPTSLLGDKLKKGGSFIRYSALNSLSKPLLRSSFLSQLCRLPFVSSFLSQLSSGYFVHFFLEVSRTISPAAVWVICKEEMTPHIITIWMLETKSRRDFSVKLTSNEGYSLLRQLLQLSSSSLPRPYTQ